MKPSLANSQFAIFDDVLPADDFSRFWEVFCNTEFQPVHAQRKSASFRMSDGSPFVGDTVVWSPAPLDPRLLEAGSSVAPPVRLGPTGTPVDRLIDIVQTTILSSCTQLRTAEGAERLAIVGRLYAHPAGTGMSWHVDDDVIDASFIYHANPKWDAQWGGELFIADETTRNMLVQAAMHDFGNTQDTAVLMQNGVGHYVLPRPNRLIVVGPGNPYKVCKVMAAAGDHVRASFSGYFVAPSGLEQVITEQTPRARRRGEQDRQDRQVNP